MGYISLFSPPEALKSFADTRAVDTTLKVSQRVLVRHPLIQPRRGSSLTEVQQKTSAQGRETSLKV